MSKFITGKELENAVYNIIWDAKQVLLIVSPFIKLDDYFKKLFNNHVNNPKLHLLLVFGKNENAVKKSMSMSDFDYFKQFPNVSIIYVSNLHAKYYGNENEGVITSINLYDYSFINNIEFGVYSEEGFLDRFKQSADQDAFNACIEIAESHEVVFIKRPVYENRRLIVNLGKNYIKSDILHDSTNQFYGASKSKKLESKRLADFPEEVLIGSKNTGRPEREEVLTPDLPIQGYCIRTGKKIKYNLKQPMSREAWLIWNEYGNENFPEKFCHKTGQASNGKTSMNNPVK